jgi:hypothetical protein
MRNGTKGRDEDSHGDANINMHFRMGTLYIRISMSQKASRNTI